MFVLLSIVGLALSACQLSVEVNVAVFEDGSGTVEVAVALDEDAVAKRPDLRDELIVDDLLDSGWTVTGPTAEADGLTWIRVSHPFSDPTGLAPLLDQIAGTEARSPFRSFSLVRTDAFASSRYEFAGTVDFSAGVETFSDPGVAELLDGEPLGQSVEALERQLGAAIDELIKVQIAVRLPGDVESNATTRARNGAVWQPSVLDDGPIELRAAGVVRRTERVVWAGVIALAAVALVLFLVIRLAVFVRGRRPT